MGLAALMEGDSDDNNNNNSAAAAAADGVAGSALTASGRVAIRRAKSSVLAPASAAAAPSRPMGLFGLLEPHHEQSLWASRAVFLRIVCLRVVGRSLCTSELASVLVDTHSE